MINTQINNNKHIILLPGIYYLNDSIIVSKPNIMILGFCCALLFVAASESEAMHWQLANNANQDKA